MKIFWEYLLWGLLSSKRGFKKWIFVCPTRICGAGDLLDQFTKFATDLSKLGYYSYTQTPAHTMLRRVSEAASREQGQVERGRRPSRVLRYMRYFGLNIYVSNHWRENLYYLHFITKWESLCQFLVLLNKSYYSRVLPTTVISISLHIRWRKLSPDYDHETRYSYSPAMCDRQN